MDYEDVGGTKSFHMYPIFTQTTPSQSVFNFVWNTLGSSDTINSPRCIIVVPEMLLRSGSRVAKRFWQVPPNITTSALAGEGW